MQSKEITRAGLLQLLAGVALTAHDPAKFGDREWCDKFKDFLQEINRFVMLLNDDRIDVKQWKRIQDSWNCLQ